MNGSPTTSVLIVDDEEDLRDVLQVCLEDEGYEVATARSGNAARALMESRPFDVLLTDVRMPDGDGIALVRGVAAIRTPVPVMLVMTGFRDLELEDARELGVRAIIRKPFHLDDLLTFVREGVGKRESN